MMKTSTLHNITNRHGLNIVVETILQDNAKGLVFLQHGMTGYKDHPTMLTIREKFLQHGYNLVTFDSTHSFGDSGGDLMQWTVTTHIADLEDVVAWAATQDFYRKPFTLGGHSMGGFSALYYAQQNPEKVAALAPISTTISGETFMRNCIHESPEAMAKWKQDGKSFRQKRDVPDVNGYVSCHLFDDFMQYDLLSQAKNIRAPVLLVTGADDMVAPSQDQKTLYDHLQCEKELHIVPGTGHTFRESSGMHDLQQHIDHWLKKILNV